MTDTGKLRFLLLAIVLPSLGGCVAVGPKSVDRDRFAYTDAISESWKRQMLLNLVKLRYADAPIFLDVSSIINQYALETEVQGGLSWNAFLPEASQNVGVRGRYADRPTITYQPISGEKFTRSLMTPIPPTSIISLIQAGWRADAVSWICIQAVNGLYNRSGAAMKAHPADPEFYRFMALFRDVQSSRAIGMRMQKGEANQTSTVMFFRKEGVAPEIAAKAIELRKLLGLNLEAQEFTIIYGSLPQNDREIAILSRSMLEILVEMSSRIDVPAAHVAEERTIPTSEDEPELLDGTVPSVRIQSAVEKPGDAFVAVPYREHWFWIDDRDFRTKRSFSFLMFLFTLAETGGADRAPILTIPAG